MKMISWNVNGLRACIGKGFWDFFRLADADIFCMQETKMLRGQATIDLPDYEEFWNSADKKGYSGTAVFSKQKPISATYDLGIEEHDHEGRVITLEYDTFFLVNCYTPNSQRDLVRLDYRMKWEDDFREYLIGLDRKKPVILCGDLNVAHKEIDLRHPKANMKNAGFTQEERNKMTELLEAGFVDSFRLLYPQRTDAYTWWSYMHNARASNAGWRIDYFIVSERIAPQIQNSEIYQEIPGSDHCPVALTIF
ncbi:exodeoxyribonuclease III [Papillibacter cinnamivorans]|uniref:Exodeoxyribonuclease-3 n=1 Tax=Papillibacter cinnamivorans DSM 12816 TaxID=1122930 RepID=A0A1W2AAB1_9FIRM|nr:exodeoxyribonuclease III [Papillibacter cinnamivorans]SMC57617.1 exodeoxyribonuclease-3 [Papillibacter cinnamivorans DSM 12816]